MSTGRAGPVLIVDDDRDVLDSMTLVLSGEGIDAVVARSAAEASVAVRTRPPSLVLLDYWLGDGDAPAVVAQLRAEDGALPIVLISGGGDLWRSAREVGAAAALPKPFTLDELMDCLAAHRR